ncbi:hypothetical protein [Actinomadura rudentiformis]|uniref:Uncharacterized protein n=1 Tax=Actinomadura rudentiformis TaxID=359158 RepID=A0A6H9YIU3_9ACTN|nr:hypothetical protein [Actinomadura rudentiformis]KAB2346594.1 hypothetical protein F8566_24460 [Actinomadura rudentiformis]
MRRTAISFAAAAIAVSAMAPAAQAAEAAVAKPMKATDWNLDLYSPTEVKASGTWAVNGSNIVLTGSLRDTTPGDIAVAKLEFYRNANGTGTVRTITADTTHTFRFTMPGTSATRLWARKILSYSDNRTERSSVVRIK